jgi:hypothetical protein
MDVLAYRFAVVFIGSMITLGCGRFGFSDGSGGSTGGGDDDDQPCTVTSVTVSEGSTRATSPRMLWNGTRFGVSWLEDTEPQSAHFRALSIDGAMDPVADLGVTGEAAQVAWDGASWRLAWSNGATNPEIMLSTNGGGPSALTANPRSDMDPRIATLSGGKIAYIWLTNASNNNVRLTMFDAAGTKLIDDRAIATSDSFGGENLVWTGSELVAFYPLGPKLMMLRMTPDGSPIAAALPIVTVPAVSPPASAFDDAFAAWAGDRFLVAWKADSGLRFTYVSRDGMPQFPPVFVEGYGGFNFVNAAIAVGADRDAIVWDHYLDNVAYLVEVFRDGTLGKPYEFEQANEPSVGWVGKTWAVAVSQTQPNAKPNYIKLVQICR